VSKALLNALRRLALADAAWTMNMTPTYLAQATRLEASGLVRFIEFKRRWASNKGYTVLVTQSGLDALARTGY
jgi:hypothetical protein